MTSLNLDITSEEGKVEAVQVYQFDHVGQRPNKDYCVGMDDSFS